MINQSSGLKVLILPLSLAIAVVATIFFIKPAYSEMDSAKKSVEEKKNQLENMKIQNEKLQKMKSNWQSLAEEKTLVAAALPEDENIDSYVSEITSKASRSGILLSGIKLEQKSVSAEGMKNYVCVANPAGTPSQAGASQPAGTVSEMENIPESAGLPTDCLEAIRISLTAVGSWEQILDFFKYLEDMNRLSNIETAMLSSGSQSQDGAASDLLTMELSAMTFFKEKNQSGDAVLAGNLANQEKFNQPAIDKLKEAVYSTYSVPAVSPSGERNIFK